MADEKGALNRKGAVYWQWIEVRQVVKVNEEAEGIEMVEVSEMAGAVQVVEGMEGVDSVDARTVQMDELEEAREAEERKTYFGDKLRHKSLNLGLCLEVVTAHR
ncbi:hypothetical protein B9Z19DRAFT_1125153 [Tuber borchii]|uniref:Uncharacterized protein n=1 Tax=Tuber borchii TaxID=42251 RepID=A0A2T6ZVD9_TUBBO|nr:hypothetical protein B9Z19DRAFT_1125153 [Tuber borchii]